MIKFLLFCSAMSSIFLFLSACSLASNTDENSLRIENRLQYAITLTEYTNFYGCRIAEISSPIELESGRAIILLSKEWFNYTIIAFTYDNNEYEMEMPNMKGSHIDDKYSNLKVYFVDSKEVTYGFKAYVQTSRPHEVIIRQL